MTRPTDDELRADLVERILRGFHRERESQEVAQYLIHPALRERLDQWLESQGFRVDRLPADVEGEDALPTYLVAPR